MNWDNVETKRLLLKGWDTSDIPFLFKHFSDEFVCKYLYDAEPFTAVEEAEQMVEFFSNENNKGSNRWVIIDKSNNQRIGTCGYMFWDTDNHSIEIGYDLQQSYSQKGIMTEALTAVIDLAFYEKGINRIQAITSVSNVASCKLLEKLGFQKEGIVRDKHYFRGNYYDHYCYSLLKREWKQQDAPQAVS